MTMPFLRWLAPALLLALPIAAAAQTGPDPYYMANVAMPDGTVIPRNCDLSASGLGGAAVTALSQANYIQCLALGPNASSAGSKNDSKELAKQQLPQYVIGTNYNSAAFSAAFPEAGGLSATDQVTFLTRLLLFRDPTPAEIAAYAAQLQAGEPTNYVFDAIEDTGEFATSNPLLAPSFASFGTSYAATDTGIGPAPYALASVTMTSKAKLKPSGTLVVQASFAPAAATGEATPYLIVTNSAGAVVQSFPMAGYFSAGASLNLTFNAQLVSTIGPGPFVVSLGVATGNGAATQTWTLAANFATFNTTPIYQPSPAYSFVLGDAYGPSPSEVLNVITPTAPGPYPVMVMFHGGGYVNGDDAVNTPKVIDFINNGYLVLDVTYRLASLTDPTSFWPAQIQDAQLVTRWARANAYALNIDPNQICTFGSSSGGVLSTWLGVDNTIWPGDRAGLYADQATNSNCAIDSSGPVDQTYRSPTDSIFPPAYGGALPSLNATDYAWFYAASPLFAVSAQAAPISIFQGALDPIVPVIQPQTLYADDQAAGVPAQYTLTPGGHGFKGLSNAQVNAYLNQACAWFASLLGPPK